MIKTVKKLSKKSLAILIALLMIISVVPFTPPISVEAADATDVANAKNGLTLAKLQAAQPETFNAQAWFDTSEAAGSNVIYCSQTLSETDQGNVSYINWRFVFPKVAIMAYDGKNNTYSPAVVTTVKTGAVTNKVIWVAVDDSQHAELRQEWKGYTDYTSTSHIWPGNATNEAFAYLKNDESNYSNSVDNKTERAWGNLLYYNGTGSSTDSDYYDKVSNLKFHVKGTSWSTNNMNKTASFTNYYINYAPVRQILANEAKHTVDGTEYNVQGLFSFIDANENKFTADSLVAYYNALNAVIGLKVKNSFSGVNDSNAATTVSTVANNISTVVSNYNNAVAGLTRQYEIVFNYYGGGGNASTAYYTAGSTVTVPETNTASNYDETQHYTYYWPSPATVSGDATYTEKRTGANHSFTDEKLTDATCTENGSTKRTCACGYSYTDYTIPAAKGHTEGTPVREKEVAATCTTDGSYDEVVYCKVCNTELSRVQKTITKLGHSFTKYVSNNNATCTQDGTETATCDNGCGEKDTRTETGSATGHDYTSVVTAPTCTEKGYTTYTCSKGDHTYKDNYTDALGHSYTKYTVTKAATCSATGTKVADCDNGCGETDTQVIAIDPDNHNYGAWVDDKNGATHTRVCSYNAVHKDTAPHKMNGNTCDDCGYVSKVTITFLNVDDTQISSIEYNVGAEITIPVLDTKYNYNNDDATHTVTTYSWDKEVSLTAVETITYRAVANTESVACTFVLSEQDIKDGDVTKDKFTCSVCGGVMYKVVADKDALNAAIVALQNDLDLPEAGYKYDAARVEAAKALIAQANALGRYEEQSVVNAKAEAIATAKTELNAVENLAKYNLNFKILNYSENNSVIAEYTDGFENLAYGTTVDFDKYIIPTIDDGSSLSGLPQYAVYKWVKVVNGKEQKLNTTDIKISDVVKSDATYVCYLMNFKATDETQTTTRVRYLDKSGNTIEFDTATIGETYTRKDTSNAPLIPYYNCTGWELVFGDETNVGTRELVYRAIYAFNETEANRCTIVGLNGVYVNGTTGTPGYTAYYDEKIELKGADKYAYANENGNIIAPINENYIFAPHLNGVDKTIYITKVETPVENATSIITGTFTTKDDPTYNYLVVNAQFYLPENATAVESGIVIGNKNDANVLKIGSATKVVSTSQGDNHEYSIQMSYSKNKTGILYARSYLIYVDGNGDTQTVYSDDITTCILD